MTLKQNLRIFSQMTKTAYSFSSGGKDMTIAEFMGKVEPWII